MKKVFSLLLALSLVLTCVFALAEANETCTYTIFNETGEKVTELYVTDNLTGEKSENFAGEEGLIAYGRNILQDKNGLVIVLNNNERAKLVRLPVCSAGFPLTGKAEIIFCSDEKGYDPNPGRFVPILQGKVTLIMPARGAWILRALLQQS